jgi:glycerophosphoryl diester phosphodiesterase
VPTLEEFANLIPPDVGLALELKSDIFLDADIAAGLVRQLDHLGVSQRSIVLSFSFERLEAVRTASPNIAQGWITLTKPWPRTGVEMLGPLWVLLYINPFYVRRAHRFGQLVCPLDPTPEARLGTYLRLGVDAVLSDNPAATCLALSRVRNRSV